MAAARIYFAVPEHYTIGTAFETYAGAVEYASSKIREIDGCPGSFTRAFVDVRLEDADGDRPLHRIEIHPGVPAGTCACGQWPLSEYGSRCPSCPPVAV